MSRLLSAGAARGKAAGPGPGAPGGPFTWADGARRAATDLKVFDRPSLLDCGYSFGLDVCPLDMVRDGEAVNPLKAEGVPARAMLVTVDPAGDTPEAVRGLTLDFGDDAVDLMGSEGQVDAAKRARRVQGEARPSPSTPATSSSWTTWPSPPLCCPAGASWTWWAERRRRRQGRRGSPASPVRRERLAA